MLKELIKVIHQEQQSYKDPITEFLECLNVNYDFDGAQPKHIKSEQVILNDPFVRKHTEEGNFISVTAEVRVLPDGLENHGMLTLDTMCNIIPAANNQWSFRNSSCGLLINCHQSNWLLVDALERIVTWEVAATWLYKSRSMIDAIGMNLKMPWDPGLHSLIATEILNRLLVV